MDSGGHYGPCGECGKTLSAHINTSRPINCRFRYTKVNAHDCFDNAVPYKSDGPLGHGWNCGICNRFLWDYEEFRGLAPL